MGLHFGIDMAANLDGGELTRVADTLQPPAFVGRYQPTYSVTSAEIAYLHARGGALLCIDNEDQTGGGLGGPYQAGRSHGVRAAGRWRALGVPAGVAVFLDVEQSFYISPNYLAGYADGCAQLGLVGGVYLNSIAGNGHNGSYVAARGMTQQRIPIFASEPQPYTLANRVADVWEPAAPEGYQGDVVVWQYCINYGASDLDLATDRGMAYMWGVAPPPPPPPVRWHVSVAGALKVAPSHSAAVAIYPNHTPANPVPVGTDVVITGPDVRTDDTWAPVRLLGPAVVHGYYLRSAIEEGP